MGYGLKHHIVLQPVGATVWQHWWAH